MATNGLQDPIRVSGGLVSGVSEAGNSVRCYKGIPFAAPPVGDGRWRAPQSVIPWEGVRYADRFAPVCQQPLVPRDAIMGLFSFGDPPESGMSEDCLYLNVWTAAQSADERLPVIVWIFGGGFRVGGGSHPVSWGSNLARRGAVVVTINYRVGALGFLAHPQLTREAGVSGNYACLDVVAALEWVRENIAAFGGDPDCVTIFGQSAGAVLVALMMASNKARGLYHRAIGGSGGCFRGGMMGRPMADLTAAEHAGGEFLKSLGASTLDEIRNVAADTLYGQRGMWGPIIDGEFLSERADDVFTEGRQSNVPLITGFTSDEASPYPQLQLQTAAGLNDYANSQFGDAAPSLLELYPANNDIEARRQGYRIGRDGSFAYQAWRWATLHASTSKSAVFNYCFSRAIPLPNSRKFREPKPPDGYGAWHGSDLWYAFDTLDTQRFDWDATDRAVAAELSSSLVRFARSGNPGQSWPAFSMHAPRAALIEDGVRSGTLPNRAALEFFTAHYAKH